MIVVYFRNLKCIRRMRWRRCLSGYERFCCFLCGDFIFESIKAGAEPLFKQENDAPVEEDSLTENDNQDDQEDEVNGAV